MNECIAERVSTVFSQSETETVCFVKILISHVTNWANEIQYMKLVQCFVVGLRAPLPIP